MKRNEKGKGETGKEKRGRDRRVRKYTQILGAVISFVLTAISFYGELLIAALTGLDK